MKFHISVLCILVMCCSYVIGLYHEKTKKTFQLSNLPEGALFGYSVSYQAKIKRLLISAPKLNLAGAIYSCDISKQECSQTKVDLRGGLNRTNMWFGAHVSSNDDFSVACAPRFVEDELKIGTFGRCFFSKDGNSFTRMKSLPLNDKLPDFELNFNSFGWSIHIDKRGYILVGGPAMSTGRVNMYTNPSAAPKPLEFQKGKTWNIAYNFGYSVTSGLFSKSTNEDNIIYAISSPYGEHGIGMVIFTDGKTAWPLETSHEYVPPVGSTFGASMCSAKLRGPGQHDALIIGAPTYAEKPLATSDHAENLGAVYIYQYDLKQERMVHHKTLIGTREGGQFGATVIDLGDLNGDKRSEIAISAPYEDGGAVYIYSAADLLSDNPANMIKWMQRFQASGNNAFGLSLVALQDYDNNGCNELAIGAPESNKVFLLQCTAKITVNVRHLREYVTKDFPRAKRNDTYFLFQSCIDVIFPEKPEVIKADIVVTVSITHLTASLANSKNDSMSYLVSIRDKKKSTFCEEVGIIIPFDIHNVPVIQYKVAAVQTDNPLTDTEFDPNHAILSDLSTLSLSDTVWVADCTDNRECNPQLSFDINSSIKDDYLIGSSETETVNVFVHNTGDDVAYSACAHVIVSGVRVRHWQPDCTLVDDVIVCTPKQPIRVGRDWSTGNIVLEMNSLKSDATKITFTVKLFPHCRTKNSQDKNKTVTLRPDPTGMLIKGSTNLGDDIFITSTELKETGKQVMHTYTVFYSGKTTWVDLTCEVMVENKPYYHDAIVMVDTTEYFVCTEKSSGNKGKNETTCLLSELKPNRKFDIIISIFIEPGKLDAKMLEKENVKISTEINLRFGKNSIKQEVISSLKNTPGVPLWIIIVSVLAGLLIIVIFAFSLYECGFLRRKNKEKLQSLKKDVYRQSMRRSMAIRESMRSAHAQTNKTPEDLDKLMENPSEAAECEDIRKELIILGLQKNIGLGGSKSKPLPRHEASPSPTESRMKKRNSNMYRVNSG